jgi:murein biosynthesis integral membrane protein MurJ
VRVRFLISQFHPRVGGAERQALLQARTLAAHGHEVVVHTLCFERDWPGREVIEGIEVRRHGAVMFGGRLRLGHGLQWLTGLTIFAALMRDRERFDALHLHQLSWLAMVGAWVAILLRKPVVVKVGSASASPLTATALPGTSFAQSDTVSLAQRGRFARWLLLHSGIRVVATSVRMAAELTSLGWPAERIEHIPNGVVVMGRAGDTPRGHDQLQVVCVARLSFEKGIDTLLAAWAAVIEDCPTAHLTIVGGGPLEAELKESAQRLGVADSVTFTGWVDEPRAYLAGADLFVLPSRYEGLPNALLEAMAHGVPAIATRVSGSEDLIDDGASGLLVAPEDANALASAIVTALANPLGRARFAERSLERVRAAYDIQHVVQRYVTVYRAGLGRPAVLPGGPLLAAAALLMTGTLATRAVGLLNQLSASSHFGAGAAMDAYFAVLAVPVVVTSLLTATLTSAVTPEYTRVRAQLGRSAANDLFRVLLWFTTSLSILLSAGLVLAGPWVVHLTAPGLNAEQLSAAEQLVPFIYPLLAINTAIGVVTAIVNAEGRFGAAAYAGVLVPAAMIAATFSIGETWGVGALAIGMLLGSALQLAITLGVASRAGLAWLPPRALAVDGLRGVLRAAAPLTLGVLIVQLSPIVDQIVASWLPVGSLSALSYSLKLIDIPVVVLFMTASRVLLPRFASRASARDFVGVERTLAVSVRLMLVCVAPISIACVLFSTPIVRLFYQRGMFSEQAVEMTAGCLVGFGLGLVPMGIGFIVPKVFNALGRNSALAWFSLVTLVTNGVLDVVLGYFWQHVGIALSTSLTYTIVTVAMLALARRYLRSLRASERDVRVSAALQYGAGWVD